MALDLSVKTSTKKDFGRLDDGAYPARIVQIIDFGDQHMTNYLTGNPQYHVVDDKGQWVKDGSNFKMTDTPTEAPDIKHMIWINFEFPDETIEIDGNDRPRWYGKEYLFSNNEKSALFKLLKAVDPKGTNADGGRNVRGMLGLPAMVTIGSTGSGKPKIAGVSGVPKGMQVGPLVNDEAFLDLDSTDVDTFFELPSWMQNRIKEGVGFESTKLFKALNGNVTKTVVPADAFGDDDIPY